jgi:hypothetical protein
MIEMTNAAARKASWIVRDIEINAGHGSAVATFAQNAAYLLAVRDGSYLAHLVQLNANVAVGAAVVSLLGELDRSEQRVADLNAGRYCRDCGCNGNVICWCDEAEMGEDV